MTAYYNENDLKAAEWLRELIKQGAIADGEVDERSIEDVSPSDLGRFDQCHFFAGIGGWALALELAGWGDRPVWTGSCPCQPFSSAGKGEGFADERHLWPAWHHLISQLQPPVIFGEQVANKDGLAWFDLVYSDLEETGYTCAALDLCAASVGAPHMRQRLYFVADSGSERQQRLGLHVQPGAARLDNPEVGRSGEAGELEHPSSDRRIERWTESGRWGAVGGCEFLPCTDGKARPVEPGTFPLAHGVSGRVGLLRGYGNAIVPQVAAEFIIAYRDSISDQRKIA